MRSAIAICIALMAPAASAASGYLRLEPSATGPAFEALSVDSLGKNKLSVNLMNAPAKSAQSYTVRHSGARTEYLLNGVAVWSIEVSGKQARLKSHWASNAAPEPLLVSINLKACHATLLGWTNEDGSIRLPALLHLPDFGTLRITGLVAAQPALPYDASRGKPGNWVNITFPAGSASLPDVGYDLDVVNLHAGPASIENDPRFDGYRRNFLSILQINPRFRVLANHSASDPAPLTLFQYAMVAAHAPELAPGLKATDLLRQTLDRYLGGMKGYGMKGYLNPAPGKEKYPYDSLDTFPSLVMAAGEYVRSTGDREWLEKNYAGLEAWTARILAYDSDGDGLLESPVTGNSGSWVEPAKLRPSNWWDTVGFGHKDAYSNALAYRALLDMSELAGRLDRNAQATEYRERAAKLRRAYVPAFYNPKTGVLAGWRSADGKLHDYYFTFVQGLAISQGLVEEKQANRIMDRLLAKMKQVGYTRFEFGLPGNLVSVRAEDYETTDKRWGGSDNFQVYENGGTSACHVYWTLKALYQLGRRKEADRILFPLLEGFEKGNFQGFGANGMSNDWRAWDGTPHGYEGLLVDNFLALLAVTTGWAK